MSANTNAYAAKQKLAENNKDEGRTMLSLCHVEATTNSIAVRTETGYWVP
jgi:hypothetical protein